MFKKLLIGGVVLGGIYALNLVKWGTGVANKVNISFKRVARLKVLDGSGQPFKIFSKDIFNLANASIEFYVVVFVDNKNDFSIYMSDLVGQVFYEKTKLADLENISEIEFKPGTTEYGVKVKRKGLKAIESILSIVTSGDFVRDIRAKGEYKVKVLEFESTVFFDEKLSIKDF